MCFMTHLMNQITDGNWEPPSYTQTLSPFRLRPLSHISSPISQRFCHIFTVFVRDLQIAVFESYKEQLLGEMKESLYSSMEGTTGTILLKIFFCFRHERQQSHFKSVAFSLFTQI